MFLYFTILFRLLVLINSDEIRTNISDDVLGLICLEFGDIQDAVVNQINDGVSTTVYISCNQGFDLVGKSKIKCINGAWEYISKPKCVKRCPAPPFINNLEIVIEGHKDQKGRYKSGAVATYTCAPSYHLTPANSAYRECKNGVWSGVNGTCVSDGCTSPPDIINGYYVLEQNSPSLTFSTVPIMVGQRVHYNCNIGYTLNGPDTLQCIDSGDWSPRHPPHCNRTLTIEGNDETGIRQDRLKFGDEQAPACPAPPAVPHALFTPVEPHNKHGPIVLDKAPIVLDVRCQSGYRDAISPCRPTRLVCLDGTWRWGGAEPVCLPSTGCVSPPPIANGVVSENPRGGVRPVGSDAYYTCAPGFYVAGNPVLTCQLDGCWSPSQSPVCRPQQPTFYMTAQDYISFSSTLLVSLATALGVMLILVGVCLVVICRRYYHHHHHHGAGGSASSGNVSGLRGGRRASTPAHVTSNATTDSPHHISICGSNGANSAASAPPHHLTSAVTTATTVSHPQFGHDPDRVALIAYADGVQLSESLLPSYEEAVRERSSGLLGAGPSYQGGMFGLGGGAGLLASVRCQRSGTGGGGGPQWTQLGNAGGGNGRSRQRPAGGQPAVNITDFGHVTRQSSSASHSAAGESMGSTDTMAVSEVSTNVTLDTVSSHTSTSASCRAACGSLASFDTCSVQINTEGVPLLEESELEEGGLGSDPGMVRDSASYKFRRCSPDMV